MLKSEKGFSLVEMMLVVGILGTLTAIGVPTFRDMKMKRKQATAKAHLGGLYSSLKMFHGQWQQYVGDFRNLGYELDGSTSWRLGFWGGANSVSPRIPLNYIGPGAQGGANSGMVNTYSALAYCGPGLRCEETSETVGFNPPGFSLVWGENTFLAGAASRFTWRNFTEDQVAIMINEQKQITRHTW